MVANKRLTIIIPHYNSPDLLEKLFNSIEFNASTQVIVVDDKSDKYLSEYDIVKQKYTDRVEFFDNTTDKKGAGVCRNIGLDKAVGQWLLFADSDDYFCDNYYNIVSGYFDNTQDMVYFMPTSVSLETGRVAHRHEAYKQLIDKCLGGEKEVVYSKESGEKSTIVEKCSCQNNKKFKDYCDEMIYTFVTPWGKLIRRQMVLENKLRFDETLVANDVMFVTKCAFCAKDIIINDSIIYCVTRMAKTLTTKKDEAKFDTRSDVFLRRFNYLKDGLGKKQLSRIHLDRIAISHVINALMYGYGFKKAFSVFRRYSKNGVPFFDLDLCNPVTVIKQAKMYLSWRLEDKRLQ